MVDGEQRPPDPLHDNPWKIYRRDPNVTKSAVPDVRDLPTRAVLLTLHIDSYTNDTRVPEAERDEKDLERIWVVAPDVKSAVHIMRALGQGLQMLVAQVNLERQGAKGRAIYMEGENGKAVITRLPFEHGPKELN